jgi:hypothetical protein
LRLACSFWNTSKSLSLSLSDPPTFLSPSLCFSLSFLHCSAELTQGLMPARVSNVPFESCLSAFDFSVFFQIGSHVFSLASLRLWSFYFHFPSSLDYTACALNF